jgi:hypothetical protein
MTAFRLYGTVVHSYAVILVFQSLSADVIADFINDFLWKLGN